MDDGALVASWLHLRSDLEAVSAVLARDVEAATGLGMTGFQVLGRLALEPGRTVPMTQLARQLCFTTGGFTKLCDRLVDLGLVERHGSRHDRRVVLAVLTDRGAQLAAVGLATYAAALRRAVVAPIGEQGINELADLARRLASATRDGFACAPPPLGRGRRRAERRYGRVLARPDP